MKKVHKVLSLIVISTAAIAVIISGENLID